MMGLNSELADHCKESINLLIWPKHIAKLEKKHLITLKGLKGLKQSTQMLTISSVGWRGE